MDKVVANLTKAVADIPNGSSVLISGFGGSGTPNNLINTLIAQGAKDLTIITNDSTGWLSLIENNQISKLIAGFTDSMLRPGIHELILKLVNEAKIEVETVPHGTLEERLRAGGVGIAGFYTPTGVGTKVALGKEERILDGRRYLLETALTGDFALVKGYQADRWGNIVCRLSALNRNLVMAMAAKITIAEVEEIVELGELDPGRIDIPGIFVDRVVKAPKIVQWFTRKAGK